MAIINSSNWSPVQPITIVTKTDLLQELVYSEVIDKRHHQLKSLRKGMDYLCLASMCRKYPNKLRDVFVYNEDRCTLSYRRMRSLIGLRSGLQDQEKKVMQWLFEYISLRSEESASKCLQCNLG